MTIHWLLFYNKTYITEQFENKRNWNNNFNYVKPLCYDEKKNNTTIIKDCSNDCLGIKTRFLM